MTAALAEGTVFAGRYRVIRCLASGGMGAVYEAVHLGTERRRAIKVMHPHLFQSEEMRERFKREARIAAHVESEHIVDVSDAGVDEATQMPFLVMELLQGEELGDRVRRLGRLPPGEVVTCLKQAATALDRTHARNIVHRDLKPENLFLTHREDGSPRIKILDFGVAKVIAEGATGAGATRSLGTPLYMAPEQFRAGARLTPAADIHALGMMAYTLLVGEPYWSAEAESAGNVIAFALTALRGPVEPATRRAAARGVMLPSGFDAWFARVTAVDPGARFPTATETMRALEEVLQAEVRAATPAAPSMSGRVSTSTGVSVMAAPAPRSRGAAYAVAAVLAIAVIGTGAWFALRPARVVPAAAAAPVVTAESPLPPSIASPTPTETKPIETNPPTPASSTSTPSARPPAPARSPRPAPPAKAPPAKAPPASTTLLGRD